MQGGGPCMHPSFIPYMHPSLVPRFMKAKTLSLWDTHLLSQSLRHQSRCNTKDVLFILTSAIWHTQIDWHSWEVCYFLPICGLHLGLSMVYCFLWSVVCTLKNIHTRSLCQDKLNLLSHISERIHPSFTFIMLLNVRLLAFCMKSQADTPKTQE